MAFNELPTSASMDLGNCGNCKIPFQERSSIVKQIMVTVNYKGGEVREDVITVQEALAVIFEIAPLTPNEGGDVTKKEVYNSGSRFSKPREATNGDEDGLEVCVHCSEMLKELYQCFQAFTGVCKLDSEIGQILKSIEAGKAKNPEQEPGNFQVRVTVKTEPVENTGNPVYGAEEEEAVGDQWEDSPAGSGTPSSLTGEAGAVKLSPPDSENDAEDAVDMPDIWSPEGGAEDEEEGRQEQQTPSPDENKLRRSSRATKNTRRIIESDEDSEDLEPEKVSFSVTGGRRKITQLQCSQCTQQFLHENTLLCHRRLIHREPIPIPPPSPLPQVELSKQHNAARLRALADANGKLSACPICRLEVPRPEIRHHLASHTRSLSKPWLCAICGRNFSNQRDLHDHSKLHISGIPCKKCGKRIPTLNMLPHLRKCMAGKTTTSVQRTGPFWTCKLCGIKFRERHKMQRHMDTHKQKKSHKCKICDKSFDRIDVLRLHIKRFHRNNEGPPSVQRPFILETDHDDFQGPSPVPSPPPPEKEKISKTPDTPQKKEPEIVPDLLTPITENRFACKGCPQTFPRASDLDTHLLDVHTEADSFLCQICHRQLQDTYCLKLHVKTHGEMKPMECFYPSCGKVYRDKNTFFYHLKEKHKMDTKTVITKYPDVFRQKNRDYSARCFRKRIGQMPVKKGKFPCEHCGRTFTQVYGLRSHIKLVHDKIKDFLCKCCGKAFARKSYFMLHEKLHTSNESPYKCHLCNKGFRLPGNLRMHLKSTLHNPNRDYVCDHCGKGFNRNDNLRLHVKTVHLKIPSNKKSRSQGSERYTHGGRNRIYLGGDDGGEGGADSLKRDAASFGMLSASDPVPVAGPSHSAFFSQQQPQFSAASAFQRQSEGHHGRLDSASMDGSSCMSGEGGDSNKPSPGGHMDLEQQQQHAVHLANLAMPLLIHPQDGRSNVDSGQQHPYSQQEYSLRGFQYRLP